MDNPEGKEVGALNPGEIVEISDGNTIHVALDVLMTCVCSPCCVDHSSHLPSRARWVQVACLAPPTRGVPPFDPSVYAPMGECAHFQIPSYDDGRAQVYIRSSAPFTVPRQCAIPTHYHTLVGICVRPTPHPNITHHLVPTLTLTPDLALSLITLATPVTPAFLSDLLKAGTGQPSALERAFLLPSADKYRPPFSQTLPPALKEFAKWAPNEARTALFNGFRFVFVGERGREAQEAVRELVRRAQGEYECVACEGGRVALRKVLAKGRAKGRILVLVGEEEALVPAVGKDGWEELVDEAKRRVIFCDSLDFHSCTAQL